jgi:thiamine monophosphate kinase
MYLRNAFQRDVAETTHNMRGEDFALHFTMVQKAVLAVCDELDDCNTLMTQNVVIREHLRVLRELKVARAPHDDGAPPTILGGV